LLNHNFQLNLLKSIQRSSENSSNFRGSKS